MRPKFHVSMYELPISSKNLSVVPVSSLLSVSDSELSSNPCSRAAAAAAAISETVVTASEAVATRVMVVVVSTIALHWKEPPTADEEVAPDEPDVATGPPDEAD